MTQQDTWQARKLNPTSWDDRRNITVGYSKEELASGKVKEITHLYAPPMGYGSIFIEHPENLEGYTPGELYTPVEEHEGVVGAVGKTLFGKNASVACGETLLLGHTSQDTARFEEAHIRDETGRNNCIFDNASVKGGTHAALFMQGNSSIAGDVYTHLVSMSDTARIKGTGTVQNMHLDGDAEIDFTGGTGEYDEWGSRNNRYTLYGSDTRLRTTQPFLYVGDSIYDDVPSPHWSFNSRTPVYVCDDWDEQDEGVTLLDSLRAAARHVHREPGAVVNVRMCLSATQHRKYAECCQCMLWYPLYLLAEPVALHYFARVDGLVGKAQGAIASTGVENLLAGLTIRDLETALRARLKQAYDEIIDEEAYPWGDTNQKAALKVFYENIKESVLDRPYVAQLCDKLGFTEEARYWGEDKRHLMYWYLNYLYQVHGIIAEELVADGTLREDILFMTALERGIPAQYSMNGIFDW